jgi:hypothetical protein
MGMRGIPSGRGAREARRRDPCEGWAIRAKCEMGSAAEAAAERTRAMRARKSVEKSATTGRQASRKAQVR